jgi:multidrug efflux pump subunit AcrB
MKPLHAWPLADRQSLVGVLTDIDDTLTTEGAITADALQALTALRAAGLSVMAVTGRPVGWSEPFARAWPVQAIVAENGAVALVREADGRLRKLYQQDAATRDRNFQRLQDVAQVSDSVQDVRNYGVSNGEPAILILLNKQPEANVIETVDRIQALLPRLRASSNATRAMRWISDVV